MDVTVGAGGTPTRARMTATLERWDTSGDRRALFLRTWTEVTDRLLTAVRNRNVADPQWVLQLHELLADHYFVTVEPDGDDLSRVTPPAWRSAHDAAVSAATDGPTAVLLGFNAALSNDLPQAVCAMLHAQWPLTAVRLERRYQDFRIAGAIIATAVPARSSTVDNWVDDAWRHALMLLTAADEGWRDAIRDCIEHNALRRAHLITCPIAGRDRLLALPSSRLDHEFPPRHSAGTCSQRIAIPSWGVPAAAAT